MKHKELIRESFYERHSKKAGVKQGSLGVLAMNEKGAQGWAGQCRPLLIIAPAVARMASTTQMACIGMAVAWQATPTCYGMVVTDFTSSKVGQSFV